MKFYSTNNRNLQVSLQEAVMQGLAPDNGLFMPDHIPQFPIGFFKDIFHKSFKDLAQEVVSALLGEDLPADVIERIVNHTIQFQAPLVMMGDSVFTLELFHGPTLAFKDFGARFLSGLVGYYASRDREITILVATSGDTGSAVANGFLHVPGTRVVVLYPSGKVSEIQEKQFTTLGGNIVAVEVNGSFDDCQHLVKQAFLDAALRKKVWMTSANSINIARLIPQTFYYFHAYAQLGLISRPIAISVPSGNFGNLSAGLMAKRMGLPVQQFVAATNINAVVPDYLKTHKFNPRPSRQTISNAMDVGNPSNFARLLDLYDQDFDRLAKDVTGFSFSDEETKSIMRGVFEESGYVMDPHGAVGYLGLQQYMNQHPGFTGIFLETAHPGKFKEVVEEALGQSIELPAPLRAFLEKEKRSIRIENQYEDLVEILQARH